MSESDWLSSISGTGDVYIDTNCFLFAVLWPDLASGRAVSLIRQAGGRLIFTPPVVRETHREIGKRYPNQRVRLNQVVSAMGRWGRVDISAVSDLADFSSINRADREMVALAAQNGAPLLTADLPLVTEARGLGLEVYQPWDLVRSHADCTNLHPLESAIQAVPWNKAGGYFFGRVTPTMPTNIRPMTVFDMPGVASLSLDPGTKAWVFEFARSMRIAVSAKLELAEEVCLNAQYRIIEQNVELALRVVDGFGRLRRKTVKGAAPRLPSQASALRFSASADGSKAFNGDYRDLVVSPGWLSEKAFNRYADDGRLAPIPEVGLWPTVLPTHVKEFFGDGAVEY